jgi:hypothetical protein
MKKILSILFLFSLIAPFCGTYLGFQLEKSRVKKVVKEQILAGITKEELVKLVFAKNDTAEKLRWEHQGEFESEGKMYDIIERKYSQDSITYWCWCDDDETHLKKQYKYLVAQALGSNPLKTNSKKQLIDYLKSLYYPESANHGFTTFCPLTDKFAIFENQYISTSCTNPPGPPPKFRFTLI